MGRRIEVEDRLSELPDEIIVHILSLLDDTKLAVQTSVLCKRWRNVWTLLSTLYLDDHSFPFNSCKRVGNSRQFSSEFNEFTTHVLTGRNQSIKLSHLTCRCLQYGFCVPQEELFHYLSIHTWESLTTLRLERIVIPPGTTFDFVSLTTLEILNCKLRPEKISDTIYDPFRGCLRLSTLQLHTTCDIHLNLEISAPLLTDLKISGWISYFQKSKLIISSPNLSSFCFAFDGFLIFDISSTRSTFPRLQKVNFDVYNPDLHDRDMDLPWKLTYDHLFKLFHAMGKPKIVTLSSRTIRFISAGLEDSKGHASPFVGVETFKIEVQRRFKDGKPWPYEEPWPYEIPENVLSYLLSVSPFAQVLVEDIPSIQI